MKKRALLLFLGTSLFAAPLVAQQKNVTGKVTNEQGAPIAGATIIVRGTANGTTAGRDGSYTVRATTGDVLQFRGIGYTPQDRTVGTSLEISVQLVKAVTNLDAVVVTALGETTVQRMLGTAQQTVSGSAVAQTGRENFVNGLQGRIAGVEVTSSSGVPGASSSITIRGISSISSSNQPLMIIDGLPLDNKTLNTGVLASDAPGSLTAFSNRGVDFTNRAADINPEDIESMVVLKGPEASALYGIDAANGAIVITTKRGKPGMGGIEYSNGFRVDRTGTKPNLQQVYGPTTVSGATLGSFFYFGSPYPANTQFYDNIDGFFRTAVTQRHNIAFSGATTDNKINYRFSLGTDRQKGVVESSDFNRVNLTGATQAQVNKWLRADVSVLYSNDDSNQPYKGDNSPLIGVLLWPQTDNAKDYLTPAGSRRRITQLAAASEVDNPYYSLDKNKVTAKTSRILSNVGITIAPFTWGSLKTIFGSDTYTNQNLLLRAPESAAGITYNGVLDLADDITRNLNAQTIFTLNQRNLWHGLTLTGLVGNQISDFRSNTDALKGQYFLDPNFISINNTTQKFNRTTLSQRRLISMFGSATMGYHDYLFATVTGRNDWTSTIPVERNSFFYPSVQGSFIFSDAIPAIGNFMTGKLRAAYANVGKDARPYAYRSSLESKTTSNGGYGYGFTGPNLALKPEFIQSREFGTELAFFDNRVTLDITTYHKQTKDQIVNDIRGSYATGFVLFNLNGAVTRNTGTEITLGLTPISTRNFGWDILTNFEHSQGRVLALPNALPESYVSDTWLFGNVRNGTAPNLSTRSLTGLFYLRNNAGKILIDPTSGLPLRSAAFIDGGYDRQPDFTMGIDNHFRYKRMSLDFLLDIRRGGDIFNATEQFLTAHGLSKRTLDREVPRIIEGVLRDGKENSATPTPNNIVVVPAQQTSYYTAISEELFIEKNINWLRLKDVTFRVTLPGKWLQARDASVYVTGTDLFLFTNYSGLDPVVNGNTAAVGGSGAQGIDFGNFPAPRGFAFGFKVGY